MPGVLRRTAGLQTRYLRNANTSGPGDATITRARDGTHFPVAGVFFP